MVKTKVYVEGGGGKTLNRDCRKAVRTFLTNAGVAANTVEVEACRGRGDAYNTFSGDARRGLRGVLLVDSEAPVKAQNAWRHLEANDGWRRPRNVTDQQCHLMVQIMESWFLADMDALESFYGQGFQRRSLPQNQNAEEVPKQDVLNGLARATDHTGKGSYNKGKHSFQILEKLDPVKVKAASPHANRFITALSSFV